MPRRKRVRGVLVAAAMLAALPCSASVTVLVGEPFGSFGTMMPTGHTTIYLDRVCADGPVKLRMCHRDEAQGVAIARLDAMGAVDWIASPIMDFLYGVDERNDILPFATADDVEALRQRYRRAYLLALLPDGTEKKKANGDWWETVGAAYIRRMWGYRLATTREQDERFVAMMNAQPNRHDYHLHKRNCSDFAAEAVNFFYPGTVASNKLADFGIMSPKQVARSVWKYGQAHPEAGLEVFEIEQAPGTLRRSRPVRGGSEMLLKTKRYLVTLCVIQPEAVVVALGLYLERGRWEIGRGAEIVGPERFAGGAQICAGSSCAAEQARSPREATE